MFMKKNINSAKQAKAGFGDLFVPKLITVMREGYGFSDFRADAFAGLTVAIVALPLSIAIAIASGASPAQGLYTAIIGGFFVSLLGGSRFQIGGPAGAFIVVVAATIQQHGFDGFLLAMILSGIFLMLLGYLRLGTYIKFIPYPVTIGFTAGIAVIIFSSQLINIFGLTLQGPEPGPLVAKLEAIATAFPSFHMSAVILCVGTIFLIQLIKKIRPNWPGMLMVVVLTSALTAIFGMDVVTIGSKFGAMPSSLPTPMLPDFSLTKVVAVLPVAVTFALLGAIESLLSAVVADGMTGHQHRSNCELVGQGVANIMTAFFSGICVTGTIARTATNIRAGARSPVAGILHAVFLLLFILVAAPLVSYIPLACLAGILAIVSWNMVDKTAIVTLLRASVGDATVLLVTFFLTIFMGITEAILVGFSIGALLFIHRMSKVTEVITDVPLVAEDRADSSEQTVYDENQRNSDVVIYRISGAFFFGAAASIGSVLDRIADTYRVMIVDFSHVPFLDATGANTMGSLAHKAVKRNIILVITGAAPQVMKDMASHGIKPPLVAFEPNIELALQKFGKPS